MFRRSLCLTLGASALLFLAQPASAQIIGGLGGLQGLSKAQNLQLQKLAQMERELLKGMQIEPELLKQLQFPLDAEALKKLQLDPKQLEQLQQLQQFKGQPGGTGGQLQWAGMRLKKPTQAEQQNLGLPENEGLQIFNVAAGSAGEKAGLKANDIIVKIGDKAAPSEHAAFAKLVQDHDAKTPMDITVLRDGKEEKIKGADMPLAVQSIGNGLNGGAGIIRINGFLFRGLPRVPGAQPLPNPPAPNAGVIPNNIQSSLSMTVNGAKISRKQNNDKFTGEYAKDDLAIAIAGKIENGKATASEIVITEKGKDAKKYTTIHDVPGQYRTFIQMLMPRASNAGIELRKDDL